MLKFTTKSTPTIEGPMIIRPTELGGNRGWIADLGVQENYAAMGLPQGFAQHDSETLARGVVRGLHFQRKDSFGRLLAVTAGRALCVAVDLRPESKSFGAANSVELNAENETMLYIPPYFALGFMTLEAGTTVICNSEQQNDVANHSGIIYDDEILAIDWQFERFQIDEKRLNISQRDKKWPSFRSYNQNALWINRPKKSKYALSRR
ncbi:MAG: dTDP-4-dehydrorhamnose 3,5-epimerase [Rikenellaceae bacterium]